MVAFSKPDEMSAGPRRSQPPIRSSSIRLKLTSLEGTFPAEPPLCERTTPRRGSMERKVITMSLVAAFLFVGTFEPSDAKKWTIYQRQKALMVRINKAELAKELDAKEARRLRDDLADIQRHKVRMISKNNGRLSYDDENDLEGQLNRVSSKIFKKKLDKRED